MAFKKVQDRIGEYLIPNLNEFVFDRLRDSFLEKAGVKEIMKGVPIPIKKDDFSGISALEIAKNMAYVIGCDMNFKYRDNYIAFIEKLFTKEFIKPLINEGIDSAQREEFAHACICFRAALLIDPDNINALYCYGRACKDSYETGEGESYIGNYKAESLQAFERLTIKAPDFDKGFYFLGYAYLNLGLYVKAKLTWKTFLELTEDKKQSDEVRGWLQKLEDPVRIEEGCNHVLAGRIGEGLEILEPYKRDERFNIWWPLWYYLGVAYRKIDADDSAEDAFKHVLRYSPSNTEAMEELIDLYEDAGEDDKAEKYRKKIEIVKHNRELDIAEKNKGMS